jgi:hypothetical protein
MNKAEKQKRLNELLAQQDIANFSADLTRSRSISVGTAFGGQTEVSMRSSSGSTLWCIMKPVEVIELIHQLAANAGCHIHIKPRDDFASWREWRVSEAEKKHLNGHPPHVNDMGLFEGMGTVGFNQEAVERTLAENLQQEEYAYVNGGAVKKSTLKQEVHHEQSMATKKTVNKRGVKRATKAS